MLRDEHKIQDSGCGIVSFQGLFFCIAHEDNVVQRFNDFFLSLFLVGIGHGRALHSARKIIHCWEIIFFPNKCNPRMHHFVKMFSLSDRERNEPENSIGKCNFLFVEFFVFLFWTSRPGAKKDGCFRRLTEVTYNR